MNKDNNPRTSALKWWNDLTLEEKFFFAPNRIFVHLADQEIEQIYNRYCIYNEPIEGITREELQNIDQLLKVQDLLLAAIGAESVAHALAWITKAKEAEERIVSLTDALMRTREQRDNWKDEAFHQKDRAEGHKQRLDQLRKELHDLKAPTVVAPIPNPSPLNLKTMDKKTSIKKPDPRSDTMFDPKHIEAKQRNCKHPNVGTDGGGDYCKVCRKRWDR